MTILLGDIIEEAEAGFACGKRNLVPDGLPHLRPFNISDGTLDLTQVYRVPARVAPIAKRLLRPGDILFNNTNSAELVGKSAVVREEFEAGYSNHLTRIRLDRRRAEPDFIAAVLRQRWQSGQFARDCTRWVGQAAINSAALRAIPVPLPPLDVQRDTVDLLGRAGSLKRLAEQAQENARELIPALFVEMFGDPSTNAKAWPLVALIDVCRPKQWPTITGRQLVETGYPVYGANGVIGFYSEFNHAESVIAVTCRGATCGTVNITMPKAYVTGNAMCLDSLSEEFTVEFMAECLRARGFEDVITGAAQPQITRQSLSRVVIPQPPLDLQRAFAARVQEIMSVARLAEGAAVTAERTGAALMSRLFAS